MSADGSNSLVLQGQEAYARDDLALAGRLFRRALGANPLDDAATVMYALVCARTGNRAAAIVYLQNALRRSPDLVDAHVALSTLQFDSGRFEEGMHHGTRAIELRPDDAELYLHLGKDLAHHGQADESLALFRKAIELDPENPVLRLEISASISDLGLYREAAESWQRFVELEPNSAIGWIGMGRVRLALSELQAAVDCGTRAVGIDPRSADAHELLGLALGGLERNPEAEDHLRIAFESTKSTTRR